MNTQMSEEVTIGKRYAVVVPKRVRKLVKIEEGQRAIVTAEAGRIVVEPLPHDPYEVLASSVGEFSYSETKHEKKAEEWLRKNARIGHRSLVRP